MILLSQRPNLPQRRSMLLARRFERTSGAWWCVLPEIRTPKIRYRFIRYVSYTLYINIKYYNPPKNSVESGTRSGTQVPACDRKSFDPRWHFFTAHAAEPLRPPCPAPETNLEGRGICAWSPSPWSWRWCWMRWKKAPHQRFISIAMLVPSSRGHIFMHATANPEKLKL